MPIDKGTTLPITQLSGLQINYKDSNSCLNPPIVTTTERDALINTNDPDSPIKNGTIVFNSTTNYLEYYQAATKTWLPTGAGGEGNVKGPVDSTNNNLVVFDGLTGKLIKDGGPNVAPVQNLNRKVRDIAATPLYQISNLGALQFGSNTNIADTGVILVDDLTPVTFQTQGTGVNAQVCTIFNGEEGAGSSSPSALVEINSTSGGFLNARMTTAQINALVTPVDGTIVYNTDTKTINSRQNGAWVSLSDIASPSISTIGAVSVWNNTTGTSLSNSNFILPLSNGANGQILSTDGNGNTAWITNSGGTITSVGIATTTNGLSISNSPITSSGSISVDLNAELQGLSSLSTTGLVARTSSGTYTNRSIATDNTRNILLTNADGISGNPTVDLNSNIIVSSIATNDITFKSNNNNYSQLQALSGLTTNTIFTLPPSNGTNGQILSTDGSGNTSWINNSSSGAPSNAQYILNSANANLPNSIVLPIVNTGVYSNSVPGSGNLYMGTNSGTTNNNSPIHDNIGIGYGSLDFLVNNASYNIAIGPQALGKFFMSGSYNVAIGYQSCNQITGGLVQNLSNNTAIGHQTLSQVSNTGLSTNNTVVGAYAANSNAAYNSCTFIGYSADATPGLVAPAFSTAIGYGAQVGRSFATVIGQNYSVGIGQNSPIYTLHLGNTYLERPIGPPNPTPSSCSILFAKTNDIPAVPTGQYDVCLWAQKGTDNGALFYQSNKGGIYKINTTSQVSPARESKIPVLTVDEIKDLDEIALGAIVYDTTNDRVLINTAKGWGSFGVNLI